ncbi:hypothetical protein PO878_16365 [Iamia majanohamensis]|uniref:Uncharacterized protein n=1 Tax=Iamia majanohamensis TaxID=467976 RepID=A0AAE9Y4K4_9ACTN|nr:hypothetical protein [Iamia majanohamensis]WCO66075.1 hypothetical protein PO878_16365 [Iamia majanohamensis]
MPHPTCSRPPAALAPDELDRLVDHLLGAHPSGPTPSPALVRARPTPDGVDLALRPLPDGVHPADLLLGHVVPRRWAAAGVVAPATARPVDGGDGCRLVVAVLVGRDGTVAHCGRDHRGADVLPSDPPPTGRLVDLLLRALGLATPPPAAPTGALWEAVWLDAVVAAAATGGTPGLGPDLADALAATTAPGDHRGWDHLRGLASGARPATGTTDTALAAVLGDLVDPADAAWMDDGCFSRWVLGALPDPAQLLDAVDALLPPGRAEAVRRAVGRDGGGPERAAR